MSIYDIGQQPFPALVQIIRDKDGGGVEWRQYFPERTCRMQFDDWEYRYRCSRCGCLSGTYRGTDGKWYAPEYCTSCGARVVLDGAF